MVELRMVWIRRWEMERSSSIAEPEGTVELQDADRGETVTVAAAENRSALALHPLDPPAQLVAWCRLAAPREACGFLLGIEREARIEVCRVVRARNLSDGTDAFRIDPGDVVRADLAARSADLQLVGFWHSHPRAPAIPSARDARAAWPGHLCVIVSTSAEPAIRAWRSVDGGLVEVPIEP
jgi:proteasome lid subunit RPN8/RPN11